MVLLGTATACDGKGTRYDPTADNRLDVTFVALPGNSADDTEKDVFAREAINADMLAAGFGGPPKDCSRPLSGMYRCRQFAKLSERNVHPCQPTPEDLETGDPLPEEPAGYAYLSRFCPVALNRAPGLEESCPRQCRPRSDLRLTTKRPTNLMSCLPSALEYVNSEASGVAEGLSAAFFDAPFLATDKAPLAKLGIGQPTSRVTQLMRALVRAYPAERSVSTLRTGIIVAMCLTELPWPRDWPTLKKELGALQQHGRADDALSMLLRTAPKLFDDERSAEGLSQQAQAFIAQSNAQVAARIDGRVLVSDLRQITLRHGEDADALELLAILEFCAMYRCQHWSIASVEMQPARHSFTTLLLRGAARSFEGAGQPYTRVLSTLQALAECHMQAVRTVVAVSVAEGRVDLLNSESFEKAAASALEKLQQRETLEPEVHGAFSTLISNALLEACRRPDVRPETLRALIALLRQLRTLAPHGAPVPDVEISAWVHINLYARDQLEPTEIDDACVRAHAMGDSRAEAMAAPSGQDADRETVRTALQREAAAAYVDGRHDVLQQCISSLESDGFSEAALTTRALLDGDAQKQLIDECNRELKEWRSSMRRHPLTATTRLQSLAATLAARASTQRYADEPFDEEALNTLQQIGQPGAWCAEPTAIALAAKQLREWQASSVESDDYALEEMISTACHIPELAPIATACLTAGADVFAHRDPERASGYRELAESWPPPAGPRRTGRHPSRSSLSESAAHTRRSTGIPSPMSTPPLRMEASYYADLDAHEKSLLHRLEDWSLDFLLPKLTETGVFLHAADAMEACLRYKQFMYFKGSAPPISDPTRQPSGIFPMPSVKADTVWHVHILHTWQYAEFCEGVIGHMVHHVPCSMFRPAHREALRWNAYRRLRAFRDAFGELPDDVDPELVKHPGCG